DVFKPFLGGAQGIINIQSPVIDLTQIAPALTGTHLPLVTQLGEAISQPISLSRPNEIYYLILAGVLLTAFISMRLSRSRLGRSWRAMREDEDVAQAMGVNLVRSKLLAFSIGAAFSGIGGAVFGSYLRSIFPNSFVLLVSINVLSLIIIGGMGSIPGVFIGALAIFGLPEALREFEEFRLLMFGGLLVLMMLLRPEGLLPPASPRLEQDAEKALAEEGA
ncbi:MAG: branched-chain amino acid ABC transporter permease, partial [Anaerolineae bacterium]|nr:branched-chain amino acid ABC transporter permease [Anaerolineae bacterium]